jgi:hypothetical protein
MLRTHAFHRAGGSLLFAVAIAALLFGCDGTSTLWLTHLGQGSPFDGVIRPPAEGTPNDAPLPPDGPAISGFRRLTRHDLMNTVSALLGADLTAVMGPAGALLAPAALGVWRRRSAR